MSDVSVIIYTMKGCPHCTELKKKLDEQNIEYYDRDIFEYSDEYQIFVEITDNDLVPSLLIIEGDETNYESHVYVPDVHYNDINEAVGIILEHKKNN
jgi:glutaredoxin